MSQRDNQVGTRWHKCDLHLHTPGSKCFTEQSITAQDFIKKVEQEGLNCIAITDHNTANWIEEIKKAANGKDITVFPGVEITCSDAKVHLLILFDVNVNASVIEDFLIKAKVKRRDFGKGTAYSELSVTEVASIANLENAIIIPAHADEFNGLSVVSNGILESFLKLDFINATQIVNEELCNKKCNEIDKTEFKIRLEKKYKTDFSNRDITKYVNTAFKSISSNKAILTFSDNPSGAGESKHGVWGIGNSYTWIKMKPKPDLESLRQALLLPEFRVKNCFESKINPYENPQYWIKEISIKDTVITGNKALQTNFSPQMTTIIGGRGTGKSTITKCIRGIFQKKSDIESLETIKNEQEDFFKIHDNSSKKGILNKETRIEINVVRKNVDYLIVGTKFNKDGTCQVEINRWNAKKKIYENTGMDEKEFSNLFPFDIYSQKQIFEIAQKPNALRDIIDNSIDGMDEIKNEIKKIERQFISHTSQIEVYNQQISRKQKYSTEILDIENQIKSYEESGYEDLLKEIQKFNSEKNYIESYTKQLTQSEENFDEFISELSLKTFDDTNIEPNFRDEIEKIINNTIDKFEKVKNETTLQKDQITKLIKEHKSNLVKSKWNKQFNKIKKKYELVKESIIEQGIHDLDNIELLFQEYKEKHQELTAIEDIGKTKLKEEKIKNKLLKKQRELRKEMSKIRSNYLRNVLGNTNVKMKVNRFRDKNDFINRFRDLIQKDTGYDRDINDITSNCFDGNFEENLDTLVGKIKSVKHNNQQSGYTGWFDKLAKSFTEEQISRLELMLPEDEIYVTYQPNLKSPFKPLSNASAGQKTSSILTFILSCGNNPLILDQPEDDLDNHLIFELIVKRLRNAKENRQIILVTHNANIPVNGDSEYIFSMNSETELIEIKTQGEIDNNEIKNEICSVMEGGKEAFIMRSKRYNIS